MVDVYFFFLKVCKIRDNVPDGTLGVNGARVSVVYKGKEHLGDLWQSGKLPWAEPTQKGWLTNPQCCQQGSVLEVWSHAVAFTREVGQRLSRGGKHVTLEGPAMSLYSQDWFQSLCS